MASQSGNILLMVLVIVFMILVMFMGSVGIISRELHVTSDAAQKERVYRVAEAGIQYVLFLQQGAGYTTDQIFAKSGAAKDVVDPTSNEVIGRYTITVEKLELPLDGVTVESRGVSPSGQFCSRVTTRLERPSGAPAGQYLTYGWTRSQCS